MLNVMLGLTVLVIWGGAFSWYFSGDIRRWLSHQYWWQQRRWLRRRQE